MSAAEVIAGSRPWWVEQGDCLAWLDSLPADSVDLCFWSPPYERARTYGIDFDLAGQAWVDWMVRVFTACRRVCKGLVACVCEGQTKNYRWSAAPALLLADLHRAGFNLRKPPVYHRVGIPGSGGPDWLRNDWEWIVCTSRPGKLPWSENTAMGHPPKWAPGGAMSNRSASGERVNDPWAKRGRGNNLGGRNPDGTKKLGTNHTKRRAPNGTKNGDMVERDSYSVPAIANPGNVVKCIVGGGTIGSDLAHENEAPFPEALAEFFVRSFCPPGGLVCDPFSGSGTTGAVAVRWGRRFVGCDVRQSQVDLTRKRIGGETPLALLTGGD